MGKRIRFADTAPLTTNGDTGGQKDPGGAHGSGTTGALVDAARELFARDGYDATSLDAVATRAGVTKGAVYHHFDSKPQLFEAVFSREIARMTGPPTAAYMRKKDPWDAFKAAGRAFLDECLDPGLQRIVLLDAPAAIGWDWHPPTRGSDRNRWSWRSRVRSKPAASLPEHRAGPSFPFWRDLRDGDGRRTCRRPEGGATPGRRRIGRVLDSIAMD